MDQTIPNWAHYNSAQDGVSLRSGPKVDILFDNEGGSTVTLTDCDRQESDGWYQCTAVNAVGSAATRARLHVTVPPLPPLQPQPDFHLHIPHTGRIIEPE